MFHPIDVRKLPLNVFSAIGDQWMLITAGAEEHCNMMTASWGGMGILWNVPMATVYIRPQRYTKEFVDQSEYFTLSFLSPKYRDQMVLCGSRSGRDLDKVRECGFTVARSSGGAPYFEEADLVLVCRKRMVQPMDPEAIPEETRKEFYENDYHWIYWGEIVEALEKTD